MRLNYLDVQNTDPAWNLALEQYVFECLPRDRMYFMLWRNDGAVVIGKYQNALAEVDLEYIEKNGIKIVRRLSGGGAVYHDLGNLNFTFITDAADEDRMNFRLFCEPVARALEKFGVRAEISGRNDMTIDGRKFSGNSQYLRKDRVLHHGTILFESDLEAASAALRVDPEKIHAKGVSSVRSRITNVKDHIADDVSLAEFREVLLRSVVSENDGEEYVLTDEDIRAIGDICDSRYRTWEWNIGRSRECELIRKVRFEGCGTIEARIDLDRGRISDIDFSGDFFSIEGTEKIFTLLKDVKLDEESLRSVLSDTDAGRYFSGLDNDGLIRLLLKS